MAKIKALFCWSGGKDSAYCLHKVISEGQYEIVYLLTTLNANFKRISMHGIREELLDKQAESLGIPLLKAWVKEGSNLEYEQQMERILIQVKAEGIEHVIFGDIFLEDLRAYREANLAKVNMKAVFPLWKIATGELLRSFIALNFKTVLCCTSDAYLNEEWVGIQIDETFQKTLPANVDPCGENGEYHTFCYDGPVFRTPVLFSKGEKTYKPLPEEFQQKDGVKGFWYIDLILA